MTKNYAKSLYKHRLILNEKSLITTQEVKATNIEGSLGLRINSKLNFSNSSNDTGFIEVFIPDR